MSQQSPRSRAYFQAFSQQLLVLGAVAAVMVPAAGIVSLDVVAQNPAADGTVVGSAVGVPQVAGRPSVGASKGVNVQPSVVPAGPVPSVVRQVTLTAATPKARPRSAAAAAAPVAPVRSVVSGVEKVTGYGIVGLTWGHGQNLAENDVKAEIRTETGGVWTAWEKVDYHPEDGPDANSVDGKRNRPGTGEALVGHVDYVQARLSVEQGAVPTDLKLSVIDPGTPKETKTEAPAIDTARLDPHAKTPDAEVPASSAGAIAPAAASYSLAASVTPKPYIYSRAQWGANESIRDASSLHYFEIHGGFVHHTVNSNTYTAAEVPGIIRGIYQYHVISRGWSDIGYNFLIDKFGRIWEGRYGGVDRAVVGAHAFGVNDYAFGVAAIGNYDQVQPTTALLNAEGALFAWKLALSGISAAATSANITGVTFNSPIQGHRDAAKVDSRDQTECPGKYLYAKIPTIRSIAAHDQVGWAARNINTNLVGSYPDVVARRASDGEGFILPGGGMSGFTAPVKAITTLVGGVTPVATPDVTGDGKADLVLAGASGGVLPGRGTGTFGAKVAATTVFAGVTNVTAVGDLNGDGKNDLIGRTSSGDMVEYLGTGTGTFTKKVTGLNLGDAKTLIGAGDTNGDHKVDLLIRDSSGVLWRRYGTGTGSFGAAVSFAGSYQWISVLVGTGDFTGDGRPDLFVRSTSGNSYVLPGDGKGFFGHVVGPYGGVSGIGTPIGAALYTGHRFPDVVGFNASTRSLYVAPNNGRTDIGTPIDLHLKLTGAKQILNVGDWNGDGFGDFMTVNTNGYLYLYPGKGGGAFGTPVLMNQTFGSTVSNIAAVGDVTGDGRPDLQGVIGSALRIFPGLGATRGFAASYVSHAAIAGVQVAGGLWNGDGAPDSIFYSSSNSTLTLWAGDGPGGLVSSSTLSTTASGYSWIAGASNATGGQHPDLLARKGSELLVRRAIPGGIGGERYLADVSAYNLLG